ncbi:MAG: Crp/Fnr family transcriptional regulator [Bacteroidetes bacterium]|nr:Crp/Fnr family transcriptional regulator [Bacteroidota bacterium]
MRTRFSKPTCEECEVRFKTYFNILSHEDLRDLSIEKSCTFFKKNQIIFYEGANPNGVYCLHKGKVKLYKDGLDGREYIIRFVAPGQLFGIKAMIERTKYSATSAAIEDSIVCFINNRKIFELIMKYPNMTNYMLVSLSRMLFEAESKMTSIALKTVRQRVAESLIIINNTYVTEDAQKGYQIRLTRDELANTVGSATETVIRVLGELKNEGLISVKGRTITITDLKGLLEVAELLE